MPHDPALAERIRARLPDDAPLAEKRMFGGLAFLVGDRMAVAVLGASGFMVRLDPDEAERAIDAGEAETMVMRGRPIRGWVRPPVPDDDAALGAWVGRGVTYARRLS